MSSSPLTATNPPFPPSFFRNLSKCKAVVNDNFSRSKSCNARTAFPVSPAADPSRFNTTSTIAKIFSLSAANLAVASAHADAYPETFRDAKEASNAASQVL
eukprot:CAMPEP_0113301020 /NCGR_PEP_ID=MMETSP0010_2-20120614/2415_1 /TAXON_ID=216773 ORGANISM="Corethron hystrix, Strain 308" /NCGR_SAMPLE_ID=MMETSP0010_2 /ASSEMBLY_ACC=CAM_ASM_000155 /LENGTH=100 /DNA_ID=CAMNT_0000154557 /DNA_START=77 /DNA_END=379 /DNA_ORIENTATION=+ /assembly_acc=CAM_ASM_000155